jgi:hypothetical protein
MLMELHLGMILVSSIPRRRVFSFFVAFLLLMPYLQTEYIFALILRLSELHQLAFKFEKYEIHLFMGRKDLHRKNCFLLGVLSNTHTCTKP